MASGDRPGAAPDQRGSISIDRLFEAACSHPLGGRGTPLWLSAEYFVQRRLPLDPERVAVDDVRTVTRVPRQADRVGEVRTTADDSEPPATNADEAGAVPGG